MEKILLFKIRLKEWSKKKNPNKKDSKKDINIQTADRWSIKKQIVTNNVFKKLLIVDRNKM